MKNMVPRPPIHAIFGLICFSILLALILGTNITQNIINSALRQTLPRTNIEPSIALSEICKYTTEDADSDYCYFELDNIPGCHYAKYRDRQFLNQFLISNLPLSATWSGRCTDGIADNGTLITQYLYAAITTPYLNGEKHGTEIILHGQSESRAEVPYVNGVRHGTEISRGMDIVTTTPWVNGVRHGIEISRVENGCVTREYVNGISQGIKFQC